MRIASRQGHCPEDLLIGVLRCVLCISAAITSWVVAGKAGQRLRCRKDIAADHEVAVIAKVKLLAYLGALRSRTAAERAQAW